MSSDGLALKTMSAGCLCGRFREVWKFDSERQIGESPPFREVWILGRHDSRLSGRSVNERQFLNQSVLP
jgi:hypothetical protein